MMKILTSAAFAVCAMALSSCYYDPYYYGGGSASVGYSSYGSGGGSTSIFISTGDSRWGYSPYYNCYYDYYRRAYYDPYLYGYYPVGYLPPVVYGVPHPHGWRPGSRYCPPPSRVRTVVLSNYNYRSDAYRRGNFNWSRNVRETNRGRMEPSNRAFSGNTERRDSPRENNRNSSLTAPRRHTSSQTVQTTAPDLSTRQGRVTDFQQRSGNQTRESFRSSGERRPFDRQTTDRQSLQRQTPQPRQSATPASSNTSGSSTRERKLRDFEERTRDSNLF
ncbi:MAG: hypothetical protein QM680_13240 [Luteolibacter sp.]